MACTARSSPLAAVREATAPEEDGGEAPASCPGAVNDAGGEWPALLGPCWRPWRGSGSWRAPWTCPSWRRRPPKSLLRALTSRDVTQSGAATLAAGIFAAWQGADYIRTHDVAAARDTLTLLAAIVGEVGRA